MSLNERINKKSVSRSLFFSILSCSIRYYVTTSLYLIFRTFNQKKKKLKIIIKYI